MPRGDKSSYTSKQKRKAEHIEEGYEDRGVSSDEAERRAWATVNKQDGGGKKSGSGRKGSSSQRRGSSGRSSSSRGSSSRGSSSSRGGSSGGFLLFWKPDADKDFHRFALPALARDMDLHADGIRVATAHYDKHVRIVALAAA